MCVQHKAEHELPVAPPVGQIRRAGAETSALFMTQDVVKVGKKNVGEKRRIWAMEGKQKRGQPSRREQRPGGAADTNDDTQRDYCDQKDYTK
jgi:hypothetical protein